VHDEEPIVPIEQVTRPRITEDVPIDVRAYSGFRADERPLSFTVEGEKKDVLEILFAWIEENTAGTRRRYCYEVVTDDHLRRVLSYNANDGTWVWRREKDVKSDS
jgi:hypothetical protein